LFIVSSFFFFLLSSFFFLLFSFFLLFFFSFFFLSFFFFSFFFLFSFHSADVNIRSPEDGSTPLHFAASTGDVNCLKVLLSQVGFPLPSSVSN